MISDPARDQSAPFPAFEQDAAFEQLRDMIQSGRPPIALVGAGASVKSGYPTWQGLLKTLRDAAPDKTRAEQWKKNLDDLNDAPWTAEVFCRDLAAGGLGSLIKQEFGSRGTLAEPHISLAAMPFPHFLTTNFDPSIEEALRTANRDHAVVSWRNNSAVSDFLINLSVRDSLTRVVYLHGRYDDDETNIILTESAYVSRYIASDDARRKLMAIFMTHPIVFVGFSMSDPDLANLMREVTARLQVKPPAHYAIMSYATEADREAQRARMEGKFGVRPVFFSRKPTTPGGDDYSNLLPLLDALAGRAPSERFEKVTATTTSASRVAEFDPEDPHKGRFGGRNEHDGRRLYVRQIVNSEVGRTLRLILTLEPLPNAAPISGIVRFYLHPTFRPTVLAIEATNGSANCEIRSFGAFTVGAEITETGQKFELDLAMLPDLPLWFRQQ